MASNRDQTLKPRKQPVQARSEATVSVLYEAAIQVLLAGGYAKFTTTKVAERAGVSIGTLYQYFPNRRALITAVIERYLADLTSAIEQGCLVLHGLPLEELATKLADLFIATKWQRIDVAQAMHEPLLDVGGAELVRAAAAKTAGAVADTLRRCRDVIFVDEHRLALFIVMACSSLLQTAVVDPSQSLEGMVLQVNMRAMILGYLREMHRLQSHS